MKIDILHSCRHMSDRCEHQGKHRKLAVVLAVETVIAMVVLVWQLSVAFNAGHIAPNLSPELKQLTRELKKDSGNEMLAAKVTLMKTNLAAQHQRFLNKRNLIVKVQLFLFIALLFFLKYACNCAEHPVQHKIPSSEKSWRWVSLAPTMFSFSVPILVALTGWIIMRGGAQ